VGGHHQEPRPKEPVESSEVEHSFQRRPELPPQDFNPLKASNETLTKYGFPPRPNRDTHPRQRAIWDRTIGLPMQIPASIIPPSPRALLHPGSPVASIAIGNLISGASTLVGRSAGVQQSLRGCTSVTASWTVPFPTPPAYARNEDGTYQDGTYGVTCAIQLDAYLQAGTVTILNVERGTPTSGGSYAYTAWLTGGNQDGTQFVNNFLVSPGDSVTFTLCAAFSTTFGTALLLNKSTQTPQWVGVNANGGPSLTRTGGTWGVSLGLGDNADDLLLAFPIPYFNPIFFTDCTVGSSTQELGVEGGKTESLSETDNDENSLTVAEASIIGPEAFFAFATGPVVG
jgi:Peptidase A4 family